MLYLNINQDKIAQITNILIRCIEEIENSTAQHNLSKVPSMRLIYGLLLLRLPGKFKGREKINKKEGDEN